MYVDLRTNYDDLSLCALPPTTLLQQFASAIGISNFYAIQLAGNRVLIMYTQV